MALNPSMLDVLDREAVLDCIADEYARQELEAQRDKEAISFRVYVSDILRELLDVSAHFIGRQYNGVPRWVETIIEKPEDNRTAEEIAADVIRRAGLTLIHSEE